MQFVINNYSFNNLCHTYVSWVLLPNKQIILLSAFKLNSIITLQKQAVRILSNADYLAHTSELFLNHKILKLDQINILQTAIFMFKLHKDEVL